VAEKVEGRIMLGFYIAGSVIFLLGLLLCIKPVKVAHLLYNLWIPFQGIFGITGKWEENSEAIKTSTRAGGVLMMVLGILLLAMPILDYLDKIGII